MGFGFGDFWTVNKAVYKIAFVVPTLILGDELYDAIAGVVHDDDALRCGASCSPGGLK